MPDISLLQPTVLMGVVQKLTAPPELLLLNRVPRRPWPFPTATWDVISGSRNIATPNVPNSEAHIVPRLGVSQEAASFIYLREKKVFEPTTIHWIRQPGQIAKTNAEAAVLREVTDLNQRFDIFMEWCMWQMLTGTLTLDYDDVQATVDYKIPTTHKPSVSVSWKSATAVQIRDDIVAWKRLIARDGQVPATTVFLSEATLGYIFHAFADSPTLLSDVQKNEFFRTGQLSGFMGLDWVICESTYVDADGETQQFCPDDSLILCNPTANRPIELLEGPTADDDAPDGFTGKFSKTWKEKDPSARQFLLEWHAFPILTRPEQFVYVEDVTSA